MFDYKQFLNNDFKDMTLEVWQSKTDKHVEIFGDKKGVLYLACRMIEFVQEEYENYENAELNFDADVDLSSISSSLRIFIKNDSKKRK